jgi:hypothetical protein
MGRIGLSIGVLAAAVLLLTTGSCGKHQRRDVAAIPPVGPAPPEFRLGPITRVRDGCPGETLNLAVSGVSPPGARVDWLVNDQHAGSGASTVHRASEEAGTRTVTARAFDGDYAAATQTATFRVKSASSL